MKKDVIVRELRGPFIKRRGKGGPPALVRRRALLPDQAIVSCGGRVFFAAIGSGGIRALKREGDRATPRARIRPVAGLQRRARPLALPWRLTRADDGWCDDPASGRYNTALRLPSRLSHEDLVRSDAIYDTIIITDHNLKPRVRQGGSAIFIHVARPGMTPTLGCIAYRAADWAHDNVPLGDYLIGTDPRPVRAKRAR